MLKEFCSEMVSPRFVAPRLGVRVLSKFPCGNASVGCVFLFLKKYPGNLLRFYNKCWGGKNHSDIFCEKNTEHW